MSRGKKSKDSAQNQTLKKKPRISMSVKGKQTAWQVPRFLSFPRVPATLCSPVVFACFAKGVANRDRQVAVHGEGVMVEVMGPADRSWLGTRA